MFNLFSKLDNVFVFDGFRENTLLSELGEAVKIKSIFSFSLVNIVDRQKIQTNVDFSGQYH